MTEELREYDALVLIAIVAICVVFFFVMWIGAVLQNYAPHLLS